MDYKRVRVRVSKVGHRLQSLMIDYKRLQTQIDYKRVRVRVSTVGHGLQKLDLDYKTTNSDYKSL